MSNAEEMLDTEGDPEAVLYKPSYVLIAIDTHPGMFTKCEYNDNTYFKNALLACYELANSLLLIKSTRSWSPFCVALGRVDDAATFINFDNNIIDTIKLLKEKASLSETDLADAYQRKSNLELGEFFLFCKKKFNNISSVYYKRTFIYITNDDNPVLGDGNRRFAALNEAKNFETVDIEFQLVTMNPTFKYDIFYNELFSVINGPAVEHLVEDSDGLLEKLSSTIVSSYFKRKIYFFPFPNDETRFLKLIQKNYISVPKLYSNAHISKENDKPVRSIKIDEAPPKMQLYSTTIPLTFEPEEVAISKHNEYRVGYTLLHTSKRFTTIGLVLDDPIILQPHPKEDLDFFDSFWQYCADNDKVLVCVKKMRDPCKIRYVELIPKFANNVRSFVVQSLPFSNEICRPEKENDTKQNKEVSLVEAPEEDKAIINNMINCLTFDYNPVMFTDPVYAKKRAFLRSKLLNEPLEEVEEVIVDNDAIDRQFEDLVDEVKRVCGMDEPAEGASKRKAPAAKGPKAKKSTK